MSTGLWAVLILLVGSLPFTSKLLIELWHDGTVLLAMLWFGTLKKIDTLKRD